MMHAPISDTRVASDDAFLAETTTLKPFCASCSAYSRPIPSEAPVTTDEMGRWPLAAAISDKVYAPAHAPFPAPYFLSCSGGVSTSVGGMDGDTYTLARNNECLEQHEEGLQCKSRHRETANSQQKPGERWALYD